MTAPVLDGPAPGTPEDAVWTLVQRAQAGDRDAFGEIYDRYFDQVYRFVFRRVRNRHLAEDLASEVWLRVLKRIESFTWQGRDFGSWVITIARNLLADHYKSAAVRLSVSVGEFAGEEREDMSVEGRPEAAVLDYLASVDLATAIRELNEHQRRVIILRFYNGCSVQETADLMGINEGAAKALQYRAVRTLARNLPEGLRGDR